MINRTLAKGGAYAIILLALATAIYAVTISSITITASQSDNYILKTSNITATPTATGTASYVFDWRINDNSIAIVNMPFNVNGTGGGNWTTIKDYTTYNHTAEYNGSEEAMPRWNSTGGPDDSGMYMFDGIDDYVNFNSVNTTGNVTFSMWLKINKNEIKNMTAGGYHACALMQNGDLYCWGANDYGQIGDGTSTQRNIPTKTLMTAATQMTAGDSHTCAINTSGMYCWGAGSKGQIGNGSSASINRFPTKNLMTAPTQIIAGYDHACATNNTGMYCWGSNNYGALGNGSSTSNSNQFPTKNYMNTTPNGQITAGRDYTCATNASGMYCWGYNTFGQIGNGSSTSNSNQFPTKNLMTDPTTIASQTYYTCAINGTGPSTNISMYCWGVSDAGQIGNGTYGTTTNGFPTKNLMTNPTTIAAGKTHACAVNTSGMYCWGDNTYGVLGDGSTANNYSPTKNLMTAATQIAAGTLSTCAVNTSGMYCWGYNYYGQEGNGSTSEENANPEPTPTTWEILTLTRNALNTNPDWTSTILNNITASTTLARTNLWGNTDWHFLTITKDNDTIKAYKDGILEYAVDDTTAQQTTLQTLGRLNPSSYYNGSIDQFGFYNKTLTPSQIYSLHIESTESMLTSAETLIGDTIQIAITPFSSGNEGTTSRSLSYTIINTLPTTESTTSAQGSTGAVSGTPQKADINLAQQPACTTTFSKGYIRTITLDNQTVHTITLAEITADTATITIKSEPFNITLKEWQSKIANLDKQQLKITLEKIQQQTATFQFTKITTQEPRKPEIQQEKTLPQEEQENTTPNETITQESKKLLATKNAIILIAIITVTIAILILMRKTRKTNKKKH